jgi:hypothetical protein
MKRALVVVALTLSMIAASGARANPVEAVADAVRSIWSSYDTRFYIP